MSGLWISLGVFGVVILGTAFLFWIACLVLGAGVEPPEEWE